MKVLIIGGVAGGMSCAARLRRLNEDNEIIVFEKGDYISYANCGLPYYVGNVIKDRSNLLVSTPELMKTRFNIDVRVNNEVVDIDPDHKSITIHDLKQDNTYQENYDKLVIATGSSPIRPNIEGIDSSLIKQLWTVNDALSIKEYIEDKNIQNISIIGGGFIGLEMIENLKDLGLNINLIEAADQVLTSIDKDMISVVHKTLKNKSINLILSDGVKAFKENNNQITTILNSNNEVVSDLVLLAIGVRPNSSLALKANLQLNQKGGIVVNDNLQTSNPDIYAVGDVIEVINYVTKEKTMIPLAGPANKQGRIAADNIAGINSTYKGSQGSSIVKIFELTVASTGVNEKTLNNQGLIKDKDYHTIIISQGSHAGYYPGSQSMLIKLIFNNDGSKIYGGQIIGKDMVDKRIDVLATVIRLNGSINDLKELELAYAPPYSSAKDPINMAGFVADNLLHNHVRFAKYDEIENSNYLVLDVREDSEVNRVHIENSIHIPLGQLRDRINELDKNKSYIIMCAAGVRAYNAYRILQQNGFNDLKVYPGGMGYYLMSH